MSLQTFTLFLHDGSGVPPAFELDMFENAEAAMRRALTLLSERPRYTAVEIEGADGPETNVTVERPRLRG